MKSYEILYKLNKFKMTSEHTSLNNIIQQVFNINICIKQNINNTKSSWIGFLNKIECNSTELQYYINTGLKMIITKNNTVNFKKNVMIGYVNDQVNVLNGDYIKIVCENKNLQIFNIYYIFIYILFMYLIVTQFHKVYHFILNLIRKKKITNIKYEENMNYSQCTICIEEFILNENICILDCNHIFHIHCLNDWINIKYDNAKCPNCNSNINTLETNQPLLNRMSNT